jgi:hypothetical protein
MTIGTTSLHEDLVFGEATRCCIVVGVVLFEMKDLGLMHDFLGLEVW